MPHIQITQATTVQQMEEIVVLQAKNLKTQLSAAEIAEQGFLSVAHTPDLLERMNQPMPHTIALSDDRVVAYALSMTRDFATAIPMLEPMFEVIDGLDWEGKLLRYINYVVMGQICVDRPFRGMGIVPQLYDFMSVAAKNAGFECIVTEIAAENKRSQAAHAKCGFETRQQYHAGGMDWLVVVKAI